MSIKSTIYLKRETALDIIHADIEVVGNDVLGDILDELADSKQSRRLSSLNNFIVSELSKEESDKYL